MEFPNPIRISSFLCLVLLLAPTQGLSFHGLEDMRSEDLKDLITVSIIGTVLNDLHGNSKKKEKKDTQVSAQQHHQIFIPISWQPPLQHHPHPLQRHPLPPPQPMQQPLQHPMQHPLQHPMQHPLQHPMQHPMMPMMHHHPHHHPMPPFQAPLPPMPIIHPQWIHPQVLAHLAQQFQMLASQQHMHSLPFELQHLQFWQQYLQAPPPTFEAISFR